MTDRDVFYLTVLVWLFWRLPALLILTEILRELRRQRKEPEDARQD